MVKLPLIIGAVVWGVALIDSMAAFADPVTDADIRGKKICWNNGVNNSYGKDGSVDSNRMGHGTWSLSGNLLTVIGSNGSAANTVTKEGGTFHGSRRTRTPTTA